MATPTTIRPVTGINAAGVLAGTNNTDPAAKVDGRRFGLEIHNDDTANTLRVFFLDDPRSSSPSDGTLYIEIGPTLGRVWTEKNTPSGKVFLRCVTATITARVVVQTRSD